MADFEIPGYEIYERLGRGGMATVYRALHLNLDREVAIKVMDASMSADESFSERFVREARISARLIHPHILQIYDVNHVDGMNYIAMEYLPGGDLAEMIRGPLDQGTIYKMMEQMTDALDYAARHGYVHRDIKPSNIMLRGELDFVLADFGIAKAADSGTQMTQTGLMVGTPSYMSPEQAKGITVDGRSDLYSLGVLWFEMTTKKLPYDSDSAVSTAVKHLTEAIPTLPESLAVYQGFLDKALAKEADDRFQSGREMFQALSEHRGSFADSDVLVQPEPVPEGEESELAPTSLDPARTSVSWADQTRVSQSSSGPRSSRPYKLSDTSRERLSSGFHSGPRKRAAEKPGFGSTGFKAIIGLVLAAGLGYGAYTYLQSQGPASSEDLRNVTAELASAYSALNEDKLDKAAVAFRKVLAIDSGHAAAQQGLQDVEAMYSAAIEQALADGELGKAGGLVTDYGLHFGDSSSAERHRSALALAQQEQQLEEVQSERVQILLDKAMAAMGEGKLFEPKQDNAYEYFMQITALNASNSAARLGLNQLMTSALEQAETYIEDKQFAEAREVVNQARVIDPGYEALIDTQKAIESAEEVELRRQNRWAEYSEEQRQTILELLARAEQQLAAEQYLAPEGDNAYQTFISVLELDHSNDTANRGLEAMAETFLARAETAVTEQRFDDAEAALANVSRVTPNNPELETRQAGLRSARQAAEESEARAAYLADLLNEAEAKLAGAGTDLASAAGAAKLFQEALKQNPGNEAASQGLARTVDAYYSLAQAAAEDGDFETAAEALDKALKLNPERNDIASMQAQLGDIEAAWREQNNEEQLLGDAAQLLKQGSYNEAAEAYARAIEMYPDSAAAEGLQRAVDALVASATKSAASGQFDAAQTMLDYALAYDAGNTDATQLQADLPGLKSAWQQEQQARAQAQQQANQTATRGLQAIASGNLDEAQAAFEELQAGYPELEATTRLKTQLRDAYLLATRDEIANQAFDLAEDFLTRGKALAPGYPDWAELEVEVEIGKSSSRRRLGEF